MINRLVRTTALLLIFAGTFNGAADTILTAATHINPSAAGTRRPVSLIFMFIAAFNISCFWD